MNEDADTNRIRLATHADRAAVRDLHLASWRANYGAELPADFLLNRLPAEMEAKWAARGFVWPELTLVVDGRDGLAGFVCALADRDPPLIDNLHVRPGLNSRGVGAALLNAALDGLAERDFGAATLTVLESNPRARAFYLRMGGRDAGTVADELVGRPVTARRIDFDLSGRGARTPAR